MKLSALSAVFFLAVLSFLAPAPKAVAAILTASQVNSVAQLLQSFGLDHATINIVRNSLNGTSAQQGRQAVQQAATVGVTPTASITVNGGQKDITVKAGDPIVKTWSSTGGTSWNMTWAARAIPGSTCIYDAKVGQHWNGLDGRNKEGDTETALATIDQNGCIFTITYVVTNNLADKNAVSKITITFPVNPTLSPSGNACVAQSATAQTALSGVVYGPGATTGIIIEGNDHGPTVGKINGTYGSASAVVEQVKNNWFANVNADSLARGQGSLTKAYTDSIIVCISINGDVLYRGSPSALASLGVPDTNNCGTMGLTSPNYKSKTFTPIASLPLLGSPLDSAGSNKITIIPIWPMTYNFTTNYGQTRIFQFTTGDVGEIGRFSLDMNTMGAEPIQSANISTVPNDFRYDNFDKQNNCGGLPGNGGSINYRVVNPTDPSILVACRVKPHTTYYFNIRNEDVSLSSNRRGKDMAYVNNGLDTPNGFLIRYTAYKASNATTCNSVGDFCTAAWNKAGTNYVGPDLGSTTTTTSGGACTAPVASSGSGIDLCKQQGLDNIDETNFSKASMVEKTGFSSSNSDLRGYVYKMGPGQSYSFPVDSDTIQLPLGAYGNTPAHTVTVSRTVLEGNPYLGSFPHIVNVSQKKCDFNPSSTGCYLIDADSDTRFTGGTIYLPISVSSIIGDFPAPYGCHLQPGKQYYVNTRWIRKSDIVDASGNIINSSMASGVLGSNSASMSMAQIGQAILNAFNSKGDTCINSTSSQNGICAIDLFWGRSAIGMPKL